MTDVTTQKPLRVSTESAAGPYIDLPVSQLEDVCRLLDDHGIQYWVSENAISFDGGPETTVINLGRKGNAAAVQAILDGVN
jgi:hypothetical protein